MIEINRPAILEAHNHYNPGDPLRLHWWDRPGGGWTLPGALARTITEVTVHWSAQRTPGGKPTDWYLRLIAGIAKFHAFDRDWDSGVPGVQGSNGIQYHYMITPTGVIVQVSAETLRTWNAYEANAHNIAICMLAGPGDIVAPAAVLALHHMLEWLVNRPDLPLVAPVARPINLLGADGHPALYYSSGVLTHDESLTRHNRPTKGCCGIYAPAVRDWRAAHKGGTA